MYSMNLTPDPTGLGSWTCEQFIQRFSDRATPRPVTLKNNSLMHWSAFAGMTYEDLAALIRNGGGDGKSNGQVGKVRID